MKTNRLYLGTEGGNIYLLDINSFELQEYIIYQDVVMQRLVMCHETEIWNRSTINFLYILWFKFTFGLKLYFSNQFDF